jgi:hypothetical protein
MEDEYKDMDVERPRYRHYFRRIGVEQKRAIIEHKLGRFPVVDVYELLRIPVPNVTPGPKFYLYYGHDERQALMNAMGEHGQEVPGTLLEPLLYEYGVRWTEDDSLGDVVNDFLDAFFSLPKADEMEHQTSTWVDQHRDRVVKDLKKRGEWDDIRWFTWPNKLITGRPLTIPASPAPLVITPFVNVEQLSYDSLAVIAAPDLGTEPGENNPRQFIDVMIVLRV